MPSAGSFEGPFGSAKCNDEIDNDCDGKTDFPADASCTAAETCDGQDNDGDGNVDEGFDVGESCSVGVSSCSSTGVKICAANGTSTVCNAVPKLGAPESASRLGSCTDKIDNDCDGATDAQDSSCGNAGLRATCVLVLHDAPSRGGNGPGRDCDSTHVIGFSDASGREGVQVRAELLALTPEGTVLLSKVVQNGELAHLVSQLDVDKASLTTESLPGSGRIRHNVTAPMPLLKVTATDGIQESVAYCTLDPVCRARPAARPGAQPEQERQRRRGRRRARGLGHPPHGPHDRPRDREQRGHLQPAAPAARELHPDLTLQRQRQRRHAQLAEGDPHQ